MMCDCWEVYRTSRLSSWQFCFHLGGPGVDSRPGDRPAIQLFLFFLGLFRQILVCYSETSDDYFIPYPFHFVIRRTSAYINLKGEVRINRRQPSSYSPWQPEISRKSDCSVLSAFRFKTVLRMPATLFIAFMYEFAAWIVNALTWSYSTICRFFFPRVSQRTKNMHTV